MISNHARSRNPAAGVETAQRTRAREILATFETIQKMHIGDRDRLKRELEQGR